MNPFFLNLLHQRGVPIGAPGSGFQLPPGPGVAVGGGGFHIPPGIPHGIGIAPGLQGIGAPTGGGLHMPHGIGINTGALEGFPRPGQGFGGPMLHPGPHPGFPSGQTPQGLGGQSIPGVETPRLGGGSARK